jgi:antitoxin component of MazEF toxin-antitoxin module
MVELKVRKFGNSLGVVLPIMPLDTLLKQLAASK